VAGIEEVFRTIVSENAAAAFGGGDILLDRNRHLCGTTAPSRAS
jgi:hypothetical protein